MFSAERSKRGSRCDVGAAQTLNCNDGSVDFKDRFFMLKVDFLESFWIHLIKIAILQTAKFIDLI